MGQTIRVIERGVATEVEGRPEIFGKPFNEALIHQVVVAYQAAARAGTKAQKSRAEVSGGGAKPWRQKGGGRARAGSSRSPLWRTGGVTFAAAPRSYDQKVNRKMYRGALLSILSELARNGRLVVSDDVNVDSPKTKDLVEKLRQIVASDARTLLVTVGVDVNLQLAARNLAHLEVCTLQGISPVALVGSEHVIFTKAAYERLEGGLI